MHVVLFGPFPPPHGGVHTHLVPLRALPAGVRGRASVINLTRHRKAEEAEVYYPRSALDPTARLAQLRPRVLHVHLLGSGRQIWWLVEGLKWSARRSPPGSVLAGTRAISSVSSLNTANFCGNER